MQTPAPRTDPVTGATIRIAVSCPAACSLYLWRVQLEGQPEVLTSIKAACLAQHYLEQSPILTLDSKGRIVSSQLAVPATQDGSCSASKALAQLQQLPQQELSQPEPLKVVVNTPLQGPGVAVGPAEAAALDLGAAAGGLLPAPQYPGAFTMLSPGLIGMVRDK